MMKEEKLLFALPSWITRRSSGAVRTSVQKVIKHLIWVSDEGKMLAFSTIRMGKEFPSTGSS